MRSFRKGEDMRDDRESEGDNNTERIRTHVADAMGAGRFMDAVLELWRQPSIEMAELGRELALMHNEGLADVVNEFSSLTKGPLLFPARHIFEQALPARRTSPRRRAISTKKCAGAD